MVSATILLLVLLLGCKNRIGLPVLIPVATLMIFLPIFAGVQSLLCGFFYLLGLLFYAKTLVAIVLLGAIRMMVIRKREPRAEIMVVSYRSVRELGLLVAIALCYLAVLVVGRYASGVPAPSLSQLIEFVWLGPTLSPG